MTPIDFLLSNWLLIVSLGSLATVSFITWKKIKIQLKMVAVALSFLGIFLLGSNLMNFIRINTASEIRPTISGPSFGGPEVKTQPRIENKDINTAPKFREEMRKNADEHKKN